jgi:tetratricopeptide (TPR) repeat protein
MIKFTGKNISILQVVLIIILGVLIYSNCSDGGFIWDDHGLIKDNNYIKSWSNFPKVITADFGAGGGTRSSFYRPLQMLMHMAGYSWWGIKTTGYHLTSIFTHILAAIIFYFFLRNIFYNKTIAFLASLLFLSFPANTEAVCYISGLGDPLVLVFILACLIFHIKSLDSRKIGLHIFALLSFVLALLSKENSVVLPLLILLYHYAFGKKLPVQKLMRFFVVLIGYIFLRLAIANPLDRLILAPAGLWERVPVFFAGITEYLRLLVLPFDLHIEYANYLFKFTDAQACLGLILAFILMILAFIKRKAYPGVFFGAGWFFIALLPVSNIYPISYGFIMEHYLYVPALGFFIVLAVLFCRSFKNRAAALFFRFFVAGLIIAYPYLTFKQSEYWRSPIVFYKRTLQYSPFSWRFYNELGIEYADAGNSREAEIAYQRALLLNPDAVGIYYNLENLYRKTGNQEGLLATEKRVNAITGVK